MIELEFLVFVSCIFLFIAGLIIISLNKRKENDRNNKQDYIRVNQKGKGKSINYSEIPENQISNKGKYKRAKQKAIESKKINKYAR
jgi:uncharacterized membrane protein